MNKGRKGHMNYFEKNHNAKIRSKQNFSLTSQKKRLLLTSLFEDQVI